MSMIVVHAHAMDGQAPARPPASTNPAPYTNEQLAKGLVPKVAIITVTLLQILKDYDNIFKSDITIQEVALKIAIFACVGATLELCFEGIPYVVKKVPGTIAYGFDRFTTSMLHMWGMPTPLSEDRLAHQNALFEDIITVVTKQPTSGTVMLRNAQVGQDLMREDAQWSFYVEFAIHRLRHIEGYLKDVLRYYRPPEGQRSFYTVYGRFLPDTTADLMCTIDEIIANINHIITVLKATHSQDDLDLNHLKMLSTNTKTLFKELKILVIGGRKPEGAAAVTY